MTQTPEGAASALDLETADLIGDGLMMGDQVVLVGNTEQQQKSLVAALKRNRERRMQAAAAVALAALLWTCLMTGRGYTDFWAPMVQVMTAFATAGAYLKIVAYSDGDRARGA